LDQFDGSAEPVFRSLAERVSAPLARPASVHVRHQWPPNFEPPADGAWVMIQPWEFGGIPAEWVEPMSRQVDEIWVYTNWVRDGYVVSGVPPEKIVVIPLGVDSDVFRPDGERFPLKTGKQFKFLFVGGTLHRKGIDVLLQAYRAAFRASDDVCLVIKGQAGELYQGSGQDEVIRQIRRDPEAPEIEYRVEQLSERELTALYRSCQAFVLPYRGEGFGLPIAEAMASGLPVIVTGRGAATDFVREDWAYVIPSRIQPLSRVDQFQPSQAGFWLEEPDAEALAALLRRAYENPEEGREKGRRARDYALSELRWERPVSSIINRLRDLASRRPCRFGQPAAGVGTVVPEALIYEPDWSQDEWVEVLLTYLLAFTPGEAVALILLLSGGPGSPSPGRAKQAVIEILTRTGRKAFPDVIVVDSAKDLADMLSRYRRSQHIPQGRGAVGGLDGAFGFRFAQARVRMCGS
jgi:glycosyltransferase involved in cell wall biosynthesis